MARQRLIQTNLSAESHGFGGNGITAKALYIWIGIPETCDGKKVCVVLDDSSRRILAGGEFDAETTENSIGLLQEALENYGWLTSIREVMTDHGTQFYANKRDKNGNADSEFENFLKRNKIVHILSPVKRPQVNGKIEKWNDTYEKNRFRFDNFDNFMNWYNTVRFHESLDTKWYLQTPDIAFWARLPEGCKLGMFLNRMETELNARKEYKIQVGVYKVKTFRTTQ